MLAYRFRSTLFTYVIAALDKIQAIALVRSSEHKDHWQTIEQWHTPDVWTRRSVNMAMAPGIIDTIPRFVVDTDNGPRYVDVDALHSANAAALDKMREDSEAHGAWIDACLYQYIGGGISRKHIAGIAKECDSAQYALQARALAGAWGLGPIPEWHAAILPALIALDIEIGTFPPNVFELDRDSLSEFLFSARTMKCHNADHHRAVVSLQLAVRHGDDKGLRDTARRVLEHLGWLQ